MCEVLYSWRLIMNKQFLSVLLLTCFVTSASAGYATPVVNTIFGVVGIGLIGKSAYDVKTRYDANVAADHASADALNAKLLEKTSVFDTARQYADTAWDRVVAGAKTAYNGTGSAANVTAQWVRNHPGYATAAVAGIAAAGYLVYRYWPKSVAVSAQDQVNVRAQLRVNIAKLMNQCPGKGFYKDGDFNKLAYRGEFFTGSPESYGVSKNVLWYLNDQVTCAHALNYIKVNNIKVEGSVIKKIQARLKEAQSKTATVFVVAPAA